MTLDCTANLGAEDGFQCVRGGFSLIGHGAGFALFFVGYEGLAGRGFRFCGYPTAAQDVSDRFFFEINFSQMGSFNWFVC